VTDTINGQRDKRTDGRRDDGRRDASLSPSVCPSLRWSLTHTVHTHGWSAAMKLNITRWNYTDSSFVLLKFQTQQLANILLSAQDGYKYKTKLAYVERRDCQHDGLIARRNGGNASMFRQHVAMEPDARMHLGILPRSRVEWNGLLAVATTIDVFAAAATSNSSIPPSAWKPRLNPVGPHRGRNESLKLRHAATGDEWPASSSSADQPPSR